MQKIICFILILFSANLVIAQCENELKLIETEKNDTAKIRKFRKAAECFYKSDDYDNVEKLLSKSKFLIDKVVLKSQDSLPYRTYLADLATFYFFKGEQQKCLKVSNELLNYDYRNSDSSDIAGSLGNIAILYRKAGNFPKAIYCLQASIKINEQIGRKELGNNYSNLANVYSEINQEDKARTYFFKAYRLRLEQKDEKGLALSYSNLGSHFANAHKVDTAIMFYSKAIALGEKYNFPDSKKAIVYNNYTDLFIKSNQIDSAKKYLQITDKLLNEKSNPFHLAQYYWNMGNVCQMEKNYKKALEWFNKAVKCAAVNNDLSRLSNLYLVKANCFYRLGNIDSTYSNRVLGDKLKDTLFSAAKTVELTRFEMQSQYDKEQQTLKSEQNKKEIEAKNAIEKRQIIIYGAVVALLLLFGLVLMIMRSNNQKKKDNVLLQQKNDLIEAQKQDIIDSINYAKNLQQAILPPIAEIKKELGESFIYYKPKDIIAGDFYWLFKLNKKEDTVLFAVADCTGHGVPGAMVSVVCSNALNGAVKEYGLTEPGKILDKAKEIVLETFSKTGQNLKDGMDISLCSINRNSQDKIRVKWAGANNSLWVASNNEIKEVTGNKQPVGYSEHHQSFTTHVLDLEKGNLLYFSTDGYYDQFGGDKQSIGGKKFMRKRLAQLFQSIKNQPLDVQLKTTEETFKNWKGGLEQIDDVCVAGIKL